MLPLTVISQVQEGHSDLHPGRCRESPSAAEIPLHHHSRDFGRGYLLGQYLKGKGSTIGLTSGTAKLFSEPIESNYNHDRVNEHYVCNDRNDIYIDLLICLEILNVDPWLLLV